MTNIGTKVSGAILETYVLVNALAAGVLRLADDAVW